MRLPRAPRSVRRQIVVLTASATAFAMLLLALVLQLVLAGITRNDVDRVLEDRADAVISSVSTGTGGTELVVPDSRLDAGVAVYDAGGVLVAGSTPRSLTEEYAELARVGATTVRTVHDDDRVAAVPFTRGGLDGVVVVTERLEPYEEAEHLALIVSLVTGALTTGATAAIAAWATRRALRPVAEMAQTAADWSEHDLGRRFALGPPGNEIDALASTLDTLLDKVSAAIRSEQRLTSELAHELRTPLTTIQGMADLVLLRDEVPAEAREDLREISAAAQRMATTITTLLELARHDSTVVQAGLSSLADVLAEVLGDAPQDRVTVGLDVPDVRLALPHALAVRTVAPVVGNALRFAGTRVDVSARTGVGGVVDLLVEDDGVGVEADASEAIFEPGTTSGTGTGAGLGLAIARRIARSVGGDVTLEQAPSAGAHPTRFVVRLPVA